MPARRVLPSEEALDLIALVRRIAQDELLQDLEAVQSKPAGERDQRAQRELETRAAGMKAVSTRFANDATDYFQIPTGRVVEVGTQVTI